MKRFLLAVLFLSCHLVKAQSGCPGVNAGPDVTICVGGSIQLAASGGFNYAWTPSGSLSDTTIYNPVATPAVTTTYYVSALVGQQDSNLIVNGNFEQGNTGFSSSYTYAGNMFPTSTYNVGTNPSAFNGNFSACADHTGGGMMMVLNGSTNANTSVWCQSVTVTPGKDYIFSMWVCKVYSTNPAQLQVTVNGQAIGSNYSITTGTCVWSQFTTIWNAGANTSASICIADLNLVTGGNDFALDDISFSPACTSTDSVTVTVQPNNIVANAGPDTTICEGGSATLTASGGSIYLWSNGAGTTATVVVSPVITTKYVVNVSSPGCSASKDSATVFVLSNPAPVITQSGDTLFCKTNAAYISYQWYYNNTLIPGATDTIYVISQNGSYSVKVTNSNGCTRTVTKTANLVVPTVAFSVVSHTCTNTCVDFTNLSLNATSYKWQFPGATPTSSTQVNPQNICYKNPGTFTFILTAYNTGTSSVKTGSITIYSTPPAPTITQSNDTLFCSFNAVYISYQWYLNSTIIPTETKTFLKVSQNGDYSVVVTDLNGCTSSATKTVGLVLPKASFTSVTGICVNSCIDFTNLSQNATSYKWQFPGATPSSDTAVNPHTICYNTAGNYDVVLIASNGITSDTLKFTNYINVNPLPPAPIVTQSGATLFSSTDPAYALYQWYYSNAILPGKSDTLLNINQSGDYKVQVTDANGCTNSSNINAVLVIPDADFAAPDSICANSCIDFTNLSQNAISYQWFFPGGMPASDTSANPKGICYLAGGSYDVILVATNTGGNDTLKLTGYLNVFDNPITPLITLVGTTLYCTTDHSYTGYQWFADAVIIPGATDTFLVINNSGNYNVQVTDKNGCQIAVGINVVLTKTTDYSSLTSSFALYPNPVKDMFKVYGLKFKVAHIEIYNVIGELVKETTFWKEGNGGVNVSTLPSGVYFIQLTTEKLRWTGKFVKE